MKTFLIKQHNVWLHKQVVHARTVDTNRISERKRNPKRNVKVRQLRSLCVRSWSVELSAGLQVR